jgi:surface protein
VGDSTTISGTTYIAVNNSTIAGQIAAGNYNLCTTLVTHMSSLFAGNSSFNSNIGFWDTSNVTTMGDLFQSADNFNQDISGWDVSNVTNMNNMFKYARSFNQNIGSWDVSSVTTMSVMFTEADDFNQDISGWNVTNVSDMYAMFNSADDFNQDISGWNVTNVSNMNAMFNSATDFNQDLTGWCVSNILSEPSDFSTNSGLSIANKPIWGTCAPLVTLTDTDANNIVTGSNVVTITATFDRSMAATPTINIIGEVSNVVMTASSTARVWIYPWTVSTTTSGIVSATIAGTDLSGNAFAGTTSITFTIDNTIPQVSSPSVSSDNLTVSITFSEQVFTEIINATGSNTLTVSDFELSLSGNSSLTLSSSTPTSISVSGNSYELKIPFNGFANGTESLTITIPNNSVFDIAGNTFSSSQTIGLNNNLLIYYDFSNPNSYNGQTTTSSNVSVTDLSGNNNDGFVRGIAEVYYDQFEDAFYFNGSQPRDGKGIAISNLNYVSGDADQINEMTIIARVKSKSQTSSA